MDFFLNNNEYIMDTTILKYGIYTTIWTCVFYTIALEYTIIMDTTILKYAMD